MSKKNNQVNSLLKNIFFLGLVIALTGGLLASPGQAESWWDVYFTEGTLPQDYDSEFENRIKQFMEKANQELLLSTYTWGTSSTNEVVVEANEAFNDGLTVQIIADGSKEKHPELDPNIPYHRDPAGDPIMHSKFIIRDPGTDNAGLMVTTNNFTEAGFSSQPGMMAIFTDFPELLNSYEQEFTERFTGTWNGGSSTQNNLTAPTGELVESLFAPEDLPINTNLVSRVTNAQHSVFFMSLLQTNRELKDAAVTAKNNGAAVEGLVDEVSDYIDSAQDIYDDYLAAGIDYRIDDAGSNPRQHHKTYVIDLEKVAFGSSNHTQSANDSNDENIVIVHDPALAREVVRDFHRHFDDNEVESGLSGSSTHDDDPPGPVSTIDAEHTATSDKSITVNWSASPPEDFNRYYVFIDTQPISTETNYNNTDIAAIRPEIATITDPAENSTEITSIKDGEALENGKDYYVGVSLVDHHGNESTLATTGPVQPEPAEPHAKPAGTISFKEGEMQKAGFNSKLELVVNNKSSAEENVTGITIDFQTGSDAFEALESQSSPPADWAVNRIDGARVEFNASNGGIAPADSQTFTIAVENPLSSGESAEISAEYLDSNGFTPGQNLGSLTIKAPGALVASSVDYSGTEDRAGRASTLNFSVKNYDTSPTDVQKVQFDFGASADHSYSVQSQQQGVSGWTVTSQTASSLEFTADNSSAEISSGEQFDFPVDVYNPRASGNSETVALTVFDDASPANETADTPGSLAVRASPDIIFNEIMYHPAGSDDDLEWVEIANRNGISEIQLRDWKVTVAGDTYTFGDQTIEADGYLVLAADLNDQDADGVSFSDSFPGVSPALDMDFSLDNTRGSMEMVSGDGTYQTAVTYDETYWGEGASGTGKTFEKVDQDIDDTDDPGFDADNWQVSAVDRGTPGAENSSGLIDIQSITVSTDNSSISTLDGTEKLALDDYTIEVEFDAPTADTPVVYWDVENDPDGSGGSATDQAVLPEPDSDGDASTYKYKIHTPQEEFSHGAMPKFLVELGDNQYDNNGNFYKWEIDDQISAPTSLADSEVKYSAVSLTWNTITDPDFSEYRIYYAQNSGVDTNDQYQSQAENKGEFQLTGLSGNTTYYFNVAAVDEAGNISELANEIQLTTKEGYTVTVNSADDGYNKITNFDGSKILREENVVVSFELSSPPEETDVQLAYDVGETPDGTVGTNGGDRLVSAAGSGTSWEAVIPAADDEITDGAEVNFVIQTGYQLHDNAGEPYKYHVDAGIDQKISDFTAADTRGGEVVLDWSAIAPVSDFSSYRIYYTEAPDTVTRGDSHWDKSNDQMLEYTSTDRTTVTGLSPGTTYKFRISPVDSSGNVGPYSNLVTATTNLQGSLLITELAVQGATFGHDWFEIYALEGPVDLQDVEVTDLSGTKETLASGKTTLEAGDYAVWHNDGQTDETDANGDLNGNGYVDLYGGFNFPAGSDDQVVLVDANTGDTIDALVYRPENDESLSEASEVQNHLVNSGHWNSSDSTAAVVTFTQNTVDYEPYAVRKRGGGEKYADNNTNQDWEVATVPTPGEDNQYLRMVSASLSDSVSKDRYDFVKTITSFDGTGEVKNSNPDSVTIEFNQHPVKTNDIQLWYSRGNEGPYGWTAANDSMDTNQREPLSYDPQSKTAYKTDNIFSGLEDDSTPRFFITSENGADANEPYGTIELDNYGRLFKFKIDDRAPLTPGDFGVGFVYGDQVSLNWSPPAQEDDFKGYRILYDTSTVDYSSNSWDWQDDSKMSNSGLSSTVLQVADPGDTYYFRLGAVDRTGNRSSITPPVGVTNPQDYTYSDTVALYVYEPLKIESLTATEGINTLDIPTLREADGVQQSEVDTVTVKFDRSVDTAKLVWGRGSGLVPDKNSDTEVLLGKIASRTYRGTIPAQPDGTDVRFRIYSPSGGYLPSSSAYGYSVDNTATFSLPDFSSDTTTVYDKLTNTANVYLSWDPISKYDVSDFKEYRIYYNQGTTVSTADPYWGPAQDENLQNEGLSSTVVQDLVGDDTYTFSLRWVDQAGNISPASTPDTVLQKTLNVATLPDPATDGYNIAHDLDGSETLRDTAIEITFEFSSKPLHPDSVYLHYTDEGEPGQSSPSIKMEPVVDADKLLYRGTVPRETPELYDGALFKYYLYTSEQAWTNEGEPFRFNVDGTPPPRLSSVSLYDGGSYAILSWDPVSLADFKQYEIRYKKIGASQWNVINASDASDLGNEGLSSWTISGLDSEANYYFNVTAEDDVQYKTWQTGDLILQRSESEIAPALTADEQVIITSPGETVPLTTLLTDIGGNPWGGEQVNFSLESDVGTLDDGFASTAPVTNSQGIARTQLNTDSSKKGYYYSVKISHPEVTNPLEIIVYTPGDDSEKELKSVPFSK